MSAFHIFEKGTTSSKAKIDSTNSTTKIVRRASPPTTVCTITLRTDPHTMAKLASDRFRG